MNVRDSCTVIRIKFTAPLLCPGSNAHIFCSIPIRPPLWLPSKDTLGHPCCSSYGFRNKPSMQSHHLPGRPPTIKGCVPEATWSQRASTSTRCRCTYSQGQLWCLSWLCPSLHHPMSGRPLSALRVFCAQPSWSAPASLTCCPQIQSEQRMSLTSFCFYTLLSHT